MKNVIMHITSAHDVDDPRIFYRHCSSLYEQGYKVVYSGPFTDINDRKKINGINVIEPVANIINYLNDDKILLLSIPKYSSRILRFTLGNLFLLRNVLRVKPTIVEFHDPDLIFVSFILRMVGYKVIANIHEDISDQILNKFWISKILRTTLSNCFKFFYPVLVSLSSNARIFATEHIKNKYLLDNSIVTRNFPTKSFTFVDRFINKRAEHYNKLKLIYVGVLEERRGLKFWNTIANLDIIEEIHLVGKFSPKKSEDMFKKLYLSHKKIIVHGQHDYHYVREFIDMCDIGICLIDPNPAYYHSLPTKIFEYICRYKPVITNNFPEVRKLLNDFSCCLFLDDVELELENAINEINQNYDKFRESCLQASRVLNWENEKIKYMKLINETL